MEGDRRTDRFAISMSRVRLAIKKIPKLSNRPSQRYKLSRKGGIKNWRVSTNSSLYFEKHPGYEVGNTAIDVGL